MESSFISGLFFILRQIKNQKIMNRIITLSLLVLLLTSCSSTIPLLTNLSDQTMLMADNKNIEADYNLVSNVPDGYITLRSVMMNGNSRENTQAFEYASTTAFTRLWDSYFSSKFNDYADNKMNIKIELLDLLLIEKSASSVGSQLLTGNSKFNVDAVAVIHVYTTYKGKDYENEFEVNASGYNESQNMRSGNSTYSITASNPMQQRAKLLESCLNKSIIQFDNFVSNVIMESEN
jgi:hypothetical protein